MILIINENSQFQLLIMSMGATVVYIIFIDSSSN